MVLLGHALWETRYGADPAVLGSTVRVNSLPATVVGVMPPGMRFPNNNDIWIPRVNLPPASDVDNRGNRQFNGIGRLASGVSADQGREEIRAIGRRLAEAYPDTNAEVRPNVGLF